MRRFVDQLRSDLDLFGVAAERYKGLRVEELVVLHERTVRSLMRQGESGGGRVATEPERAWLDEAEAFLKQQRTRAESDDGSAI